MRNKTNALVIQNLKKASVLIYSIVLTSIALILAVVVMNNYSSLIVNQENIEIERRFYYDIKSNIDLFGKYLQKTNNDGSGFVDKISCPGAISGSSLFTMSGTTNKGDLNSTLFNSNGTIICVSNYNNKDLEIYFNNTFDGFGKAIYDGKTITFSSGPNFIGTFTDSDNTKITIPENSYKYPDGFDDNFNNDNYSNITTLYEDNDNYVRKTINGFIEPKQQKNIFWNNYKIEDYINGNSNNSDTFNEKLGDITSGFLHLEINKQAKLTLIKINKTRYKDFREFERIETLTGSISSGSGYIKWNGSSLELNATTTGAYNFDFKKDADPNKGFDYILFLTNLETNQILNYTLIGKTSSGKGIYLNPIDDSNSNDKGFKVLGYDVIINKKGNIMGKMIEMVGNKKR